MDVIVIYNGLGNQMSQYAFFLQKKALNGSTTYISTCDTHNGLELNKVFDIRIKDTFFKKILYILYRILRSEKFKIITVPLNILFKSFNFKTIKEDYDYTYNDKLLLPSKGLTFYIGGWHSEKYFSKIKNQLYKEFEFVKPLGEENIEHEKNILKKNSVSIHIRRGDYLTEENINVFGGVCNISYYEKAISLIESKIHEPHFFIFSNDIDWVKSNLTIKNVTHVTCNVKENSWKDMYLMSICKHNIIANSTFSWWGAWLNKNTDKIVISPSKFLNTDEISEIYPEYWIRLPEY